MPIFLAHVRDSPKARGSRSVRIGDIVGDQYVHASRKDEWGIPAAGPGDDHHAKLAARLRYAPAATQLGRETRNALTFNLGQSTGAGQKVATI